VANGYRYSRFCELYRGWASRISVTMRQTHAGGDKLFIDYAGDTVPVIIDRLTGQTRPAQIFVAVMGASNFTTYAEASWPQALVDWIGAHIRASMLFAHLKRILKLNRLRLRGPSGAKDEFLLAAIARNLRKLAKLVEPPPAYAMSTGA
jgi:transposase